MKVMNLRVQQVTVNVLDVSRPWELLEIKYQASIQQLGAVQPDLEAAGGMGYESMVVIKERPLRRLQRRQDVRSRSSSHNIAEFACCFSVFLGC
jgi:hypothetical protein